MPAPQLQNALKAAQLNEEMRRREKGIAMAEAVAAQQRQQLEFQQTQREQFLAEQRARLQDMATVHQAKLADEQALQEAELKRKEALAKAQGKAGARSPAQMALEGALKGTEVNGRNINQTNPDYAGGNAVGALMEGMTTGGPQPGGPQGGAVPTSAAGAPPPSPAGGAPNLNPYSAPPTLTSTQTQTSAGTEFAPSRGLFSGYVGLPQVNVTQTTRTDPNVLTAAQAAELNMAERNSFVQDVKTYMDDDIPPDQAVRVATAMRTGDPVAIAQATKGMKTGISLQTKRAALNGLFLENQTRQMQLNLMEQLVSAQGAAAQMDPLSMGGLSSGDGGGGAYVNPLTGNINTGRSRSGSGGGGAHTLGQWATAASIVRGKGTAEDLNQFALMGLQESTLRSTNGRTMAFVKTKAAGLFDPTLVADGGGGLQLYSSGAIVDLIHRAARGDREALLALPQYGFTVDADGALDVDYGNPNNFNATFIKNYVESEARFVAAAKQRGEDWVGPLQPSRTDVSAALRALQAAQAPAKAAPVAPAAPSREDQLRRVIRDPNVSQKTRVQAERELAATSRPVRERIVEAVGEKLSGVAARSEARRREAEAAAKRALGK